MKNIFAFTETGTLLPPGFVSVNEQDTGQISVSVRSSGGEIPAFVNMTRVELNVLHDAIGDYLFGSAEPETVATKAKK